MKNHDFSRRHWNSLISLIVHVLVVGCVVAQTDALTMIPRVLFCSSVPTDNRLRTVFYDVVHVVSTQQARKILAETPKDSFTAIVVDDTTWDGGDLINYCARKGMSPARLVLSSTLGPDHCYGVGADVVVSTVQELKHAHDVLIHDVFCPENDLLHRRHQREATLQNLAGGALTYRVQQLHSHSQRLQQQLKAIQPQYTSPSSIKVVHISDTHNYHRHVRLPRGDLLLHTGDIVGNYRETYEIDLLKQFTDFLDWIAQEAYPKYDRIVFLAGNHDTYLDPVKQPKQYEISMHILHSFLEEHPNVSYLHKSSVFYRGLEIYGTPTTICRVEAQKRNMLSNGFERTIEERYQDWESIPECDILLTHLPPSGLGLSSAEDSCPMLTNAVYRDARKAPRLHAFGHIHSQFGVVQQASTILSNASQERMLKVDLYGGGSPIVLNLAI